MRSAELVAGQLLDPSRASQPGSSAAAVAATMLDSEGLPTRRLVVESSERSVVAVAAQSSRFAPRARGRRWLVIGAAALAVVGLAGAWVALGGGPSDGGQRGEPPLAGDDAPSGASARPAAAPGTADGPQAAETDAPASAVAASPEPSGSASASRPGGGSLPAASRGTTTATASSPRPSASPESSAPAAPATAPASATSSQPAPSPTPDAGSFPGRF
jgi:hypothetical protein